VADFLGGLKSRDVAVLAVLLVQSAVGLALTAVIVGARAEPMPGSEEMLLAGASAFAGIAGLAAFYRAMAVGTMSVVAPISATAAAIPVTVGIATGDRLSAVQVVGLAMAFAGVVVASREPPKEGHPRTTRGAGLALVAAAGFGTFFLLMDSAADADPFWAIVANRVVGVTLLVCVALALRPKLPARVHLPALAVVGVLDVGANGLFAIASREGLVSVVATLASLYPVVTILLARAVLNERISTLQQFGVAAALAGVAAISAG
jgi:drug/metabolite transporter (DMT)-like permease